jgi:hypothetical protein
MDDNQREQQKQLLREVVKEFIDNIDRALGKFMRRALGTVVILGVLYVLAKFGMIDKLIGY